LNKIESQEEENNLHNMRLETMLKDNISRSMQASLGRGSEDINR